MWACPNDLGEAKGSDRGNPSYWTPTPSFTALDLDLDLISKGGPRLEESTCCVPGYWWQGSIATSEHTTSDRKGLPAFTRLEYFLGWP